MWPLDLESLPFFVGPFLWKLPFWKKSCEKFLVLYFGSNKGKKNKIKCFWLFFCQFPSNLTKIVNLILLVGFCFLKKQKRNAESFVLVVFTFLFLFNCKNTTLLLLESNWKTGPILLFSLVKPWISMKNNKSFLLFYPYMLNPKPWIVKTTKLRKKLLGNKRNFTKKHPRS